MSVCVCLGGGLFHGGRLGGQQGGQFWVGVAQCWLFACLCRFLKGWLVRLRPRTTKSCSGNVGLAAGLSVFFEQILGAEAAAPVKAADMTNTLTRRCRALPCRAVLCRAVLCRWQVLNEDDLTRRPKLTQQQVADSQQLLPALASKLRDRVRGLWPIKKRPLLLCWCAASQAVAC